MQSNFQATCNDYTNNIGAKHGKNQQIIIMSRLARVLAGWDFQKSLFS